MSRKAENRKKGPVEPIELDATILDILFVDKNGQPGERPTLFTATKVRDRQIGAGFTAKGAIASLREECEREDFQ